MINKPKQNMIVSFDTTPFPIQTQKKNPLGKVKREEYAANE